MDAQSQQKVVKAGFKIIRKDDQPNIRIKFKSEDNFEWQTLEKFSTKKERDARFNNLLELNYVISD